MDILVTTPKSEIDNSRQEGAAVQRDGGYWFRTFRFRPKVEPGDKIYFVENGLIRGYGIIFEVSPLSEAAECDFTGRTWGDAGGVIVKYHDWHWLKTPVEFSGFQGIRYLERLPGLREKLLRGGELKRAYVPPVGPMGSPMQ
jgi:hypothetical protein